MMFALQHLMFCCDTREISGRWPSNVSEALSEKLMMGGAGFAPTGQALESYVFARLVSFVYRSKRYKGR